MAEAAKEENVPPPNGDKSASQPTPRPMVSIPEEELQELKKTSEEYKDKYLRLLAEMDNARKRMQKERHDLLQHGIESIIAEFLNPIDNLENALKYAEDMSAEVKHWAFGFQMILTQLKDVLALHGVLPFQSEGQKFDPHFHEAVEMVATKDYPAGTIVSESVRGYKMGDRTIRPARVKVAKAPE